MTSSALASRGFRARTVCVQSANRIETELDLDFGIRLRRTFLLDGFEVHAAVGEARNRAKHCLVVLAGGRSLVVRPDPRLRDRWHGGVDLRARVFLCERVFGRPVGYMQSVTEAQGPALELGPYMSWLASTDFDVEVVKDLLNGGRS